MLTNSIGWVIAKHFEDVDMAGAVLSVNPSASSDSLASHGGSKSPTAAMEFINPGPVSSPTSASDAHPADLMFSRWVANGRGIALVPPEPPIDTYAMATPRQVQVIL